MARDVPMDGSMDVSTGFVGAIEASASPRRRRDWPDEVKGAIVAESLMPGVGVTATARRHGVTRWQIYYWRRLVRQGRLALPASALPSTSGASEAPFFAAVIVDEAPAETAEAEDKNAEADAVTDRGPEPAEAGVIELVVGEVVIRAPAGAGEAHLARVIRAAREAGA